MGTSGGCLRPGRRAVHDHRVLSHLDRSARSSVSRPGSTPVDVPEAHHVLDGAQLLELPQAERRAPSPSSAGTDGSMRSMTPASSSPRNSSAVDDDAVPPPPSRSATMPRKTAGSGWRTARLNIHGSRGRTQAMASGSTPRASNQMQASVAVLPEPTTTYWLGALVQARPGRCGGTTRAPAPTPKGGGSASGCPARGSGRRPPGSCAGTLEPLARDAATRAGDHRCSPCTGRSRPCPCLDASGSARARSRRRSPPRSPARAGPPLDRAPAARRRRAASRRRRRRPRPGAAGRRGRRRASAHRRCAGDRRGPPGRRRGRSGRR